MKYDVFYSDYEHFIDFVVDEKTPNIATLETHVLIKSGVEANDLEDLFRKMQGESWTPNKAELELIRTKIMHTSMSVGDLARDEVGTYWVVRRHGFEALNA